MRLVMKAEVAQEFDGTRSRDTEFADALFPKHRPDFDRAFAHHQLRREVKGPHDLKGNLHSLREPDAHLKRKTPFPQRISIRTSRLVCQDDLTIVRLSGGIVANHSPIDMYPEPTIFRFHFAIVFSLFTNDYASVKIILSFSRTS